MLKLAPIVTRSLAFCLEDHLLMLQHGPIEPEDADWNRYVDAFRRELTDIQAVLVSTEGPGPNTAQRKRLMDIAKDSPMRIPTVVLTPSRTARGIVTALSWLGTAIT
ncbi:MAG: hypothetical protein AAB426_12195, partial [Myxococcota bacterium]